MESLNKKGDLMNFKNIFTIIVLFFTIGSIVTKQKTSKISSNIRPPQAEPFRNRLIEEYSNEAKSNDRFTKDFIMLVDQSSLTNGQRKDVFEYAINYYDLLEKDIQA